jgi:hypothetical protein
MAKKHKEIKRWAAGVDVWDDTLVTARATLVETPKQFRMKDEWGAADRMFSRFLGRQTWSKDVHPEVGYPTEASAIQAYRDSLAKQIKQAQSVLRSRVQLAADVDDQVLSRGWNTFV